MDASDAPMPAPAPARTDAAAEPAELRKPHEMIVLLPRSRRVTLTGRRLYNALLQVAQARLAAMQGMPPADHMFEAPLPALLRTSGASSEDRTAAKRYLREMRGLEVDWESTAPGDGLKWRGFSMLSEVAIEIRHGENWVSWSYPPTLMAALKEPARWARIDLQVLARLGTYAAVALYEICARYRDNPSGLTSRKPVAWWADALSPAPAGTERREWRKFKSERVKEAIDEINRETELEIELIEHKQGRAVVEAQFAVRRKRLPARPRAEADAPVDAHLVLRAESLGIREIRLEALLAEFGEQRVRDKLQIIERRAANSQLRGIENAHSYLRALLRQDDAAPDDAASPASPATAAASLAAAQALSPLPGLSALVSGAVLSARPDQGARPDAAAPRPPALGPGQPMPIPAPGPARAPAAAFDPNEWLRQRMAEIKREIAALDPVQRQPWVDMALSDLGRRGLLSAVISRRAAQGDVLHGVLGSALVRVYATAQLGPGWDLPPAP